MKNREPVTSDRNKSLEELDGQRWGKPEYDSHLVMECHRLRRVPLRSFTVENLRIMIGQSIGLDHLVPLALERLQENPLAEGDFYPGDLLVALLGADAKFWLAHPQMREHLVTITERAISLCAEAPDRDIETLTTAFIEFKKRQTTR